MPLESVFDSATQPVHFDPAALRHDLFDSTPALLNVLHTFHPWLADMRAQLRGAVDAANAPQLAGLIHTLRGSAASIGALDVTHCASTLEAALHHVGQTSTQLQPLIDELEAALGVLIQGIAQAQQQPGSPPPPHEVKGASLEKIRRSAAELGALLAEDDILSVTHWRSQGALLEALQPVEARQIGEAIDNFEFELAHQYLNAYITHHLEDPAGA